jgi:hypothetical protein
MAARKRSRSAARPNGGSDGSAVVQENSRSTGAVAERVALAVYGVFFAALLLTCSPMLDSKFALPKSVVLSAGVFSLAILLLVHGRRIGQTPLPPLALLLGISPAGWWVLSTPFALHLPTTLFGEYDYYNGLYTHLCFLALFVVSMSLPLGTRAVHYLVALLVASISIVATVNVTETAGMTSMGLAEASTLGDRVAAGDLMNFAIPFVVVTLIRVRRWDARIGLGALLALLLVSEFISQGRDLWVGLLMAMLILMAGLITARFFAGRLQLCWYRQSRRLLAWPRSSVRRSHNALPASRDWPRMNRSASDSFTTGQRLAPSTNTRLSVSALRISATAIRITVVLIKSSSSTTSSQPCCTTATLKPR